MKWGMRVNDRITAEQRRRLDKVRLEKIRSDADETKELAELEAKAYQSEIEAQAAQDKAKQLRKQAGHLTMGERLAGVIQGGSGSAGVSRIASSIGNALSAAGRNLLTPDDEPKRRAKRTVTKRSTTK